VRRLVLAAALAAAAPALAEPTIGGVYAVRGSTFSGLEYTGTATVTFTDDVTCGIVWVIATETSEGLCIRHGNSLSASVIQGGLLTLVVYDLGADGSLSGFWTAQGANGVGFETLEPPTTN
jgi:hypothetical protein